MSLKKKKIFVTGGAGFIGSHVAEYYARRNDEVVCFDNLSRAKLLNKEIDPFYNWKYLENLYPNIHLIKGDIRDFQKLREAAKDADVIVHCAAQTAVTSSIQDPRTDFKTNALGTFNVLEAARQSSESPTVIYCSTNKVYGANVNKIKIIDRKLRYEFQETFEKGIPETLSIDLCEHTPYGCSKLTGDLYMQDYAHLHDLKTGIFRMSCVYGPRQLGVEDQGWIAWFTIATVLGKPTTIYGDGKQVRDVLFVTDLINAFDSFARSKLPYGVFNIGGGPQSTLSVLELLDMLEELTGKRSKISFAHWRPGDQRVYTSDVTNAKKELDWTPTVCPKEGVREVVEWVEENESIFLEKKSSNENLGNSTHS